MTLEMLYATLLVRRAPARHAAGTTNAASASRAPTPLGLRSQAYFESVGCPLGAKLKHPTNGK